MTTPMRALRLPRGPDAGGGRGFDPTSPRYLALCCSASSSSSSSVGSAPPSPEEEQRPRAAMRERFLRCLVAAADRTVHFLMYGKVRVAATFGASDVDVLNFQVSDLRTPIGVQTEALIRCHDVISYSFDM